MVSPPGYRLDVEASLPAVGNALLDLTHRTASVVASEQAGDEPTLDLLQQQLQEFLTLQGFTGLFSLYLVDLQSQDRLNINLLDGESMGMHPGVAYSGMSIMKIVILAEFYRQITDGALPYELDLVQKAITESSNWTANLLIEWIGDLSANNVRNNVCNNVCNNVFYNVCKNVQKRSPTGFEPGIVFLM